MNPRSLPSSLALAASLALALGPSRVAHAQEAPRSDPRPRADLDALFTYGIGNGSALGGALHGTASLDLWRAGGTLGTLDLGVLAGYQNEPTALQPWVENDSNTGTTHRAALALTAGHALRFGPSQRLSVGLHLYAGAVHWISSYRVTLPQRGIDASRTDAATVPDVGAFLRFTARPHANVGLSVQAGAPFYGVAPDTVVGLFTVGLGLTLRLR